MEALKTMAGGCLLMAVAIASSVALPAIPTFVTGITLALGFALVTLSTMMLRWMGTGAMRSDLASMRHRHDVLVAPADRASTRELPAALVG